MTESATPEIWRTLALLKISGSIAAIAAVLAFVFPRFASAPFRRIERFFARFAQRPALAIFVIFISVIALRLAILPLLPVPIPGIHDEFSYLLMGDTFAHGRLANPPHPLWISFETFHVNFHPTYSSMYPPAQGFVLAFGEFLGNPWIGVLLSVAALCGAIFWMLQAWMPARWALLGAILCALKFGIASYWMNSYWGGAAAAIGGALVLGALPRIVRAKSVRQTPQTRHALVLGLGIAILANSRPYEGVLFCIPVAIWFIWWLLRGANFKQSPDARLRIRNILVPLAIVLIATAIFMGFYNFRLTGSALLFPHTLNTRTYHTAPLFLWQHPKPEIHYRNPQFEEFYNGWERENYDPTWIDAARVSVEKIIRGALTYLWLGAIFLFPGIPPIFRDKKIRPLLFVFVPCALGVFAVIWSNAHYAAPLTCVIFAFIVQAIRYLRAMRKPFRRWGLAFSRVAVLLLIVDATVFAAMRVCDPLLWPCEGDSSRAAIAQRLQHTPGKHLVIVRYEKDHNVHDEWVYNGADIDDSKVLWARDLDAQQNAKLFAYFKDRRIWLVNPDLDNIELVPYPRTSAPLTHNAAQSVDRPLSRAAQATSTPAKPLRTASPPLRQTLAGRSGLHLK